MVNCLLLVVVAAAAPPPARRRRRLHLRRFHGRARRWRSGTLGHDPQLDGQVLAVPAVDGHDPGGVDATGGDQVVLRAVAARLSLAGPAAPAAVADQVALRGRVVLKFYR